MVSSFSVLTLVVTSAGAQIPSSNSSILQQHYDRAQSLQAAGDKTEAARQYRIFIADALDEMALQHAHHDEYQKAAPLFDEALRLAPNSPGLKVGYAQAALRAQDLARARTLAEGVLRDYPANPKASAKAHLILGRILQRNNHYADARQQLEMAVAQEPNFENGYALAIACLDGGDGKCASRVFAEMVSGLGDTAAIHMAIGRAYLNSDFQPEALPEFQKVITRDDQIPGAHYSLAVAYLTIGGDNNLDLAEAELKRELKQFPKDAATHVQLGNVALRQHKYDEAERELKSAIALDASSADAYLYLGQLYHEIDRNTEAITALRESISLTRNPSYNHYQVQKAHYLLGRLLTQSGETEAGRQETTTSADLMKQSLNHDRSQQAGYLQEADKQKTPKEELALHPVDIMPVASSGHQSASAEMDEFEKRVAPAIADSYNNLGAIAAGDRNYLEAMISFGRASEWNPSLEGLDANWGRAAFLSGRYSESIAPLTRSLNSHSTDTNVRLTLAAAYSALARVETEQNHPEKAVVDLEAAVKLDPANPDTHKQLAAAYSKDLREDDAHREQGIYNALNKSNTAAGIANSH